MSKWHFRMDMAEIQCDSQTRLKYWDSDDPASVAGANEWIDDKGFLKKMVDLVRCHRAWPLLL